MSIRIVTFATSCVILILAHLAACPAAIITNPSQIDSNAIIIDFESLPDRTQVPITDGFATITAQSGNGVAVNVLTRSDFLEHPGIYEGQFLGFGPNDYFIEFDRPVAQFGFGIIDPNWEGNIVRAYDSNNNIIETIVSVTSEFPVGATGGDFSTYVGFVRLSNDIKRIELIHAPAPNANQLDDHIGIDNVTYYELSAQNPRTIFDSNSYWPCICFALARWWRKQRQAA